MKRRFLPEVIEGFRQLVNKGDLDPNDEDLKKIMQDLQQAAEELENGKTDKAIEILEWELKRKKMWKESFIDLRNDAESSKKAEEEIEAVERFIQEIKQE